MNWNKLISQSQELVKHYVNSGAQEWLLGIQKNTLLLKDEEEFGTEIKYLYLYQRLKEQQGFPEWFLKCAQQKKEQVENKFRIKIKQIIDDTKFNHEVDSILERKNITLYQKKINIYSTSIIDDLPPSLRLNIYYKLYKIEPSEKMNCYLRNNLATTLTAMGQVKLAQRLSLYNWVISQEFQDIYFANTNHLKTILKKHSSSTKTKHFSEIDEKASVLARELCVYYQHILNIPYTAENTATLDLVTACYDQYSELKEILLPVKTYLRTQNKKEFYQKIENLKKAFIYKNYESLSIQENSDLIRDQLIIYNELLKFCKPTGI